MFKKGSTETINWSLTMYTHHTTYQVSNLFDTLLLEIQFSAFRLYTNSIAKYCLIAKQQKTCAAQIFLLFKNLNF